MLKIQLATTDDEREAIYRFRYPIYVEEKGFLQDTADHAGRRLVDPEDARSWIVYAENDGKVVASTRITWGGVGLSARQIEQYGVAPFLAELPAECLAVGERVMIASDWRGTELLDKLATALEPVMQEHGVLVVFGCCEPHLISYYCRYQRPHGTRNINSDDAYLIPLVSFRQGTDALVGMGEGTGLPRCVQAVLDGTGTVRTPLLCNPNEYRAEVLATVGSLDAPVFADLDECELAEITARSSMIRCAEGDRVLKKGGDARNVYVVLSGALEVHDGDHPVAVLLPGDVFGETAFLLHQRRTYDVDALRDDTRILSLSERTLCKLMDDRPAVAVKFLANLSRVLCRRLTA
jgi:hypothetical protein